ncbi:MAG: DNA mismatch repair protein MutS [Candidatus Puniceispirillum sp.]|nr:DNA mismatch repair protein MutS [Candidatus Puniceispirillum sp.]MBL6774752.1 DNA mismatch repair protein MutS [Candidatus Puniceispirillum sp.]
MMEQYLRVKDSHQNALLFYRMGDFYEMFFEDAEIAAKQLGITLTKRGSKDGFDVPMCGVPVHAVDGYLARLIRAGHRVAICEQVEDPQEQKKRGGKGPLKRDVVRVLTPGTLTEDELLSPAAHNYLVALGRAESQLALAWADMSTGDFFVQEMAGDGLETLLARLDPAELIYPQGLDLPGWFNDSQICLTEQAALLFDSTRARQALERFYQVASLDGMGHFSRAMLSAGGALLGYLEATQVGNMPRLLPLTAVSDAGFMEIDPATRRSLELSRTLTGERRGSLLHAVDRTLTAAGGRLLGERLAAPLFDVKAIDARLDLVGWFIAEGACADLVRAQLRIQPDIERALSRLSLGHGGPRDLANIADGLESAGQIVAQIRAVAASGISGLALPDALPACLDVMLAPRGLTDVLVPALGDELPLLARDGGFVRQGYDLALDDLRELRDENRRLIAALQSRYADETGIASLKIKHNNVLGYHIDVRSNHAAKLMDHETFIHRQTTAQAVRFTTTELAEMERDMASAADRALALELEIFDRLRNEVLAVAVDLGDAARALAEIDVATASAQLAISQHYCRPKIVDEPLFDIVKGRHPVIEPMLDSQTPFIANDCNLDDGRLWLLTGPNMAGKSTFLRQNAHIAIMAQAGLYVPAERVVIGLVDRLFSRVGAADDLARGRSTFMVEMVETAAILNRATSRSLVILDEIGRGTATYDGLAIAWSTLEYLHDASLCRTLFATHYHELTHLQKSLEHLRCHAMQVREWQGSIVFLHQVVTGAADRSYGVHVARLAGLPAAVLGRAEQILGELETGQHGAVDAGMMADSLPLFEFQNARHYAAMSSDEIAYAIDALQPDSLAPREALDILYRLKALRAGSAKSGDKTWVRTIY